MKFVDASAIRRLHILSDCILVGAGWICAYWLRYSLNDVLGKPINSFQWYVNALPVVVLPWVFSCWVFGIYRSNRMKTVVDELQLTGAIELRRQHHPQERRSHEVVRQVRNADRFGARLAHGSSTS